MKIQARFPLWNVIDRSQEKLMVDTMPHASQVIIAATLLACASATNIGLRGANTDTLHAGETLTANQQLTSSTTKFIVQDDGNLVLYQTNTGAPNDVVLWASNTHASTTDGLHLILQGDGNLVLYGAPGPVIWASNTSTATELVAQSDCNLPVGFLQSLFSARTQHYGRDAHACVLLCVVSTGCCGTVH